MTKARWVRLVAGLFVLSLVVAACSSDDGGGGTTGTTGGATETVTVDVSASTGFHCKIHPQMTGQIEVS